MCDESTETENETYLEGIRLSRRAVGMGTGAAFAAMLPGCTSPHAVKEPKSTPPPAPSDSNLEQQASLQTVDRMVAIDTPDGTAEAFFVAPSGGQHPGVLMWPDVAGLRAAYKTMATRLAGEGYAVLVVNQYYRSAQLPVLDSFAEWRTDAGKEKIRPMREAITPEGITSDGAAFIQWLDQQPEVDTTKQLASAGYCMGGPFTFRTAAAAPQRVGAIASFHGGGLVTDETTSPHTLLPVINAALLICIAQNDDEREPGAKSTLRQAAEEANLAAEIEVYPAQHGWCTIDSPVYDEEQAERAWARMLATFKRNL